MQSPRKDKIQLQIEANIIFCIRKDVYKKENHMISGVNPHSTNVLYLDDAISYPSRIRLFVSHGLTIVMSPDIGMRLP